MKITISILNDITNLISLCLLLFYFVSEYNGSGLHVLAISTIIPVIITRVVLFCLKDKEKL